MCLVSPKDFIAINNLCPFIFCVTFSVSNVHNISLFPKHNIVMWKLQWKPSGSIEHVQYNSDLGAWVYPRGTGNVFPVREASAQACGLTSRHCLARLVEHRVEVGVQVARAPAFAPVGTLKHQLFKKLRYITSSLGAIFLIKLTKNKTKTSGKERLGNQEVDRTEVLRWYLKTQHWIVWCFAYWKWGGKTFY